MDRTSPWHGTASASIWRRTSSRCATRSVAGRGWRTGRRRSPIGSPGSGRRTSSSTRRRAAATGRSGWRWPRPGVRGRGSIRCTPGTTRARATGRRPTGWMPHSSPTTGASGSPRPIPRPIPRSTPPGRRCARWSGGATSCGGWKCRRRTGFPAASPKGRRRWWCATCARGSPGSRARSPGSRRRSATRSRATRRSPATRGSCARSPTSGR